MKKILSLLLAAMLPFSLCAATAQAESATPLPCGAAWSMTLEQLQTLLGEEGQRDSWLEDDTETGSLRVENPDLGVGDLTATDVSFQVDRNNSAREPRLSIVTVTLPTGDNVIVSFKKALEAFTQLYGAPDSDPFDEIGVTSYMEYGSLDTSWTKEDVRIHLSMNRMYDESLMADYTSRKNYDPADLQ